MTKDMEQGAVDSLLWIHDGDILGEIGYGR